MLVEPPDTGLRVCEQGSITSQCRCYLLGQVKAASSESLPPGDGKWSPRETGQRKSFVSIGSIRLVCCE